MFTFDYCGAMLKGKHTLENQILKIHQNQTKYSCEIQDENTPHHQVTGRNVFAFDYCGAMLKGKHTLENHTLTIH